MSKRSRKNLAVVILAAGKGKRMKTDRPKVLFDFAGWPLVRHVVETARALDPARMVAVVGHGRKEVEAALTGLDVEIAFQREQLGTGHAVKTAKRKLEGKGDTVLVLLGDVPLTPVATLKKLVATHHRRQAGATILTVEAPDPSGYGRVLRGARGQVLGIREEKDASAAERAVREVNTGIMAFRADALWPALKRLRSDNAQGEYYLTDVPGFLLEKGEKVAAVSADCFEDGMGVNSLAELSTVSAVGRDRILAGHMERGVRIADPATTYVDRGVVIGRGTTIFPFTVITGDVRIGRGCEVGPFSHLRTGTRLEDGAQIGNFVEVKKTVVGKGTKAKHLTYLGDAVIGDGTNVGCGTITANYDGQKKHRTELGSGVHVGSGTVFVAPIKVGDGVVTGAGAILLAGHDVEDGKTVVGMPARVLENRKGKR
ncbi:MAG: bifunctional UDP-N-acetylglucosamine diphosphorylase/glucosamine-1-phosphate N-acetyltransferase GlmU [Planctomycetota bacterium]|jgi:bifunctional UDP-N-acetylglucosamine pyrophosphorylase/glucosamine-1-phosphate N-acetyltransferase